MAIVVQTGNRLTGSMKDGVTDNGYSVTEAVLEAKFPPGRNEQIVDRLRRMFPIRPPPRSAMSPTCRPIRSSRARHWLRGYFKKTYEGTEQGGYNIETNSSDIRRPHVVHYGGRVSGDGQEIAGKWWIEDRFRMGRGCAEASFTLRRQEK